MNGGKQHHIIHLNLDEIHTAVGGANTKAGWNEQSPREKSAESLNINQTPYNITEKEKEDGTTKPRHPCTFDHEQS